LLDECIAGLEENPGNPPRTRGREGKIDWKRLKKTEKGALIQNLEERKRLEA